MPICALMSCTNSSRNKKKDSGVTFHRFLKCGHEKRDAWIKFVQKDRRDDLWLPNEHSCICSIHFRDEDKYLTKGGRNYLQKNAVPQSAHLQCALASNVLQYDDDAISETHSESESIFDTPGKIVMKRNVLGETVAGKQLAITCKKILRQNLKLKQINESYVSLVKHLKTTFGLDPSPVTDLIAKAEVVELQKTLLRTKKQNKNALMYTAPLRKFALTLNYYSPAAYKYVHETFDKVLPHPKTVSRWYSTINAEPGFTSEAFTVLELKCQTSEKPVVCSLIFDEVAIISQKLSHKDRKLGMVNFGAGPVAGEEDVEATQALVFMVVSLDENWKLPVGYFLVAGISAERKANLTNICLDKCHEVGVTVASLTFNGCAANFKAAEILGCELSDVNNLKTYFYHPTTKEKVCIFIDPCHIVKLIRNTLERKRLFFDSNNGQIRWQLLTNLIKLQHSEELLFGNKLKPQHLHFRNQIIKVKLATQLLSRSVAKALILCNNILKSNNFKNSSATVKFITLVNDLFDILKSRKYHFYGYKRPIDAKNKDDVFAYLNKIKSYIINLKVQIKTKRIVKRRNQDLKMIMHITHKKVVESSCKTGFLGAVICIESVMTLYGHLVEERKLINYISLYQISQDHLELFIGLFRKHSGYNNNPNIIQFRSAYKKNLNHLELRSAFSGNCISLDNFTMLNLASVNVINSTSNLSRHDLDANEVLESTRALESDLEAEANCKILANMLDKNNVNEEAQLIVGYISGFVSRCLIKSLKCETCNDALIIKQKLPYHKLITFRDMGGLCYSSEDVYLVCLAAEMVIRHLIKKSRGESLSTKYIFSYITVNTLKMFIDKEVFSSLTQHSLNQPPTFNHRIHLIRGVVNKFATIRLKHEAKLSNDYFSVCQKINKLVLFKEK